MGAGKIGAEAAERPSHFTDVLRTRVFAVLYGAENQSTIGDQLARVALSFLVFQRTGSAAATALTYAATYLPAILGGVFLAGIGDRLPRRFVMIGCDLLRAGLFAAMALPGLPTIGIIALLVIAVFLGPAFSASEISYLAAALDPELFRVGTGLRMISNQASQVFGFALGGLLVAAIGPRQALLVNAGTFLLSAAVVAVALPRLDGPGAGGESTQPAKHRAPPEQFRGLWGERRARALLALSALAGLFIVPEGLAVPFGSETGASTTEIGLLLASIPLGGALGAAFLVRLVAPARRSVVARWMAVGCGLPLVVTGLVERWPLAVACWFVSGALAAYQVDTTTSLVHLIPDTSRSRLIGVASSVLLGAQGLGLIVFAGIAQFTSPAHAIGVAGLLGSSLALALVLGPLRERRRHSIERSVRSGIHSR
jgi:hypothetical protein